MTTDYLSVAPDLQIADAIEDIRRRADEAETLDSVYVVTGEEHLIGYDASPAAFRSDISWLWLRIPWRKTAHRR